jgi:hypothetical protein
MALTTVRPQYKKFEILARVTAELAVSNLGLGIHVRRARVAACNCEITQRQLEGFTNAASFSRLTLIHRPRDIRTFASIRIEI